MPRFSLGFSCLDLSDLLPVDFYEHVCEAHAGGAALQPRVCAITRPQVVLQQAYCIDIFGESNDWQAHALAKSVLTQVEGHRSIGLVVIHSAVAEAFFLLCLFLSSVHD